MATKKTIQLEVDTNAQDAQKKFDSLREQIKRAKDEVQAFEDANVSNSKEAKQASQQLEQLEQSYKDLNKSTTDLGATFEDVYGEVKPLTAQMGEMEDRLYQMSLAGDTSSKAYHDLLTEVGKYRKIQMDTDMVTDAAATTMSQKLGGAIQGAASGFAVAQGTMALFGTESEELEETLIKLNAAMAISQGIQGLREGAKSFKTMGMAAKNALKGIKSGVAATGIGVFLIAVGAIAANWDRIKSAVSGLSQAQKDLTAQTQLDLAASEAKFDTITNSENTLRLSGKTEEEIRNMKIKQLEATLKISEADLDRQKQTKEGQIKAAKRNEKILEGVLTFLLMPLKVLNATYNKIRSKIPKKILNLPPVDILGSVTKALYNADTIADDLNDGIKQSEDKIVTLRNQIDGLKLADKEAKVKMLESAKDKDKKEVESAEDKAKRLAEIEKQRLAEQIEREDAQYALLNSLRETEKEKEITALVADYEEKFALAVGNAELEKELEGQQKADIAEIEDRYRQEKEEKDKEASDKKLALIEEERQARLKATDDGLNWAKKGADALQQLGDLVFANKMSKLKKGSKEEEKLAKKQFKFNKAMQLSGAIIDAGKAIIASLASAPLAIGVVPNPAGIASLALTGLTSAMNIAKIASTKFESGGSGAPTDTPSLSGGGGGAASAPSFNVVGDSGMNQLAQLQMQPTQAYVVSGDITTAQSLDRNKIENATI